MYKQSGHSHTAWEEGHCLTLFVCHYFAPAILLPPPGKREADHAPLATAAPSPGRPAAPSAAGHARAGARVLHPDGFQFWIVVVGHRVVAARPFLERGAANGIQKGGRPPLPPPSGLYLPPARLPSAFARRTGPMIRVWARSRVWRLCKQHGFTAAVMRGCGVPTWGLPSLVERLAVVDPGPNQPQYPADNHEPGTPQSRAEWPATLPQRGWKNTPAVSGCAVPCLLHIHTLDGMADVDNADRGASELARRRLQKMRHGAS